MTTTEKSPRPLPVVELFGPTIQGEGAMAGRASHFIRFGFCDGARGTGRQSWCSWCDSMEAVDPTYKNNWRYMTPEQIVADVDRLPGAVKMVTLTGGNPALHDLGPLVDLLWTAGYSCWVETQGTVYPIWLDRVRVTVSPKPPSAGGHDPDRLAVFMENRRVATIHPTALKVVVDPDNRDDCRFAESMFTPRRLYPWASSFLSVVTYPDDDELILIDRWRRATEWFLDSPLAGTGVVLLPQLHALLWLHQKGR